MKAEKKSIKIPRYWIVQVNDYHEFNRVKDHYWEAGINTKYQELDCPGYFAIFWIGAKPSKKTIEAVTKNFL